MNNKVMIERYKQAILEMYNKAENVSGTKMYFDTYEDLVRHLKDDPKSGPKAKILPFMCFYLDKKTQDEIIEKATKGCYYCWVWPKKIPIGGDPKFNKYLRDIEDYEREKKSLTPWFRKKRKKEIAEKYNLQWRSRQAESLRFEIWNTSPNCSRDSYKQYKDAYKLKTQKKKVEEKYKKDIDALIYLVRSYLKENV